MPIPNRYALNHTLFTRKYTEKIVRYLNSTDATVDADTGTQGHGICSGITSAWIVSVLNANKVPGATQTGKFEPLFLNVLRYQGAYFKELHGKADNMLETCGAAMITNGTSDGVVNTRVLTQAQLPGHGWWAAYVSMRGHAIGIGKYGDLYLIMEPNFGLFSYETLGKFLTDLADLVDSFMTFKHPHSPAKRAKFIFYKRTSGKTT